MLNPAFALRTFVLSRSNMRSTLIILIAMCALQRHSI